jgi:hypothetical protein
MNYKLSKVLKLIGDLSKQELMTLNQAVVSLIKTQAAVDVAKASVSFNKGDIVSYIDSNGIRVHGVITKKNPKTIQVTTENNYYVNIPASYLTLEEKPSAKLLDFRKKVAPTTDDIKDILESEFKKHTLH